MASSSSYVAETLQQENNEQDQYNAILDSFFHKLATNTRDVRDDKVVALLRGLDVKH